MKRFLKFYLVLVLATVVTHAAELTNADAVLDFAVAKTAGYESYSATFAQSLDMPNWKSRETGTIAFKRPAQMRRETSIELNSSPQPQQMVMVIGSDQIVWQQATISGQTKVMKTDLKNSPTNSPVATLMKNFSRWKPEALLAKAKDQYTFTLLPAAELRGQRMYVLAGELRVTAKPILREALAPTDEGKILHFIGQQDGFLHRVEQRDKTGSNTVYLMEFTNLKLNTPLADSLFTYHLAPGANVIDVSQLPFQLLKLPLADH